MKITKVLTILFLISSLFLVLPSAWASDVRGVTDKSIKLGMLYDLSGPGRYAAPWITAGSNDFIAWINDKGGVHGRTIELIHEDNGMSPNKALAAAKKVIFKDNVFAIVYSQGSAATSAIIPLCEEHKVVVFPMGANKHFYVPGNKWVFVPTTVNFSQASRGVEFILNKDPKAKIGVIYQDDGFGREGLDGARAAAEFMNTKLVKEMSYKRGAVDLSPHVRAMREADVDFIVLWTYLPQTAAVIKERAKMGWDVGLLTNSTNPYPAALFHMTGEIADGLLITVPYMPIHSDVPGVKQVKEVIKKYGSAKYLENPMFQDYSYMVIGWSYMNTMVEGLRRAGRDFTPEKLVKALESVKDLDQKGIVPDVTFGPDRHVSSFETSILRFDAQSKKFVLVDPYKEPKTPQD